MPTKKSKVVDLFAVISEKTKPVLTFRDIDLPIFHPSVISKKESLRIHNSQRTVSKLTAELSALIQEAEELENIPLKDKSEDQQAREEIIHKRRFDVVQSIDAETLNYIAALSKLEPEVVKTMILDAIKKLEHKVELSTFASIIFKEINDALIEYNESELDADSTTEEKKA